MDRTLKGMIVYAIVYNLVCVAAAESAQQRQAVDSPRISFIDGLRWIVEGTDPPTLDRVRVFPHRPGPLRTKH